MEPDYLELNDYEMCAAARYDIRQLQLVALVGRDEEENPTVISICTTQDLKRAAIALFEGWPQTRYIDRYALTLASEPVASFNRAEVEHLPLK